MWLLELVICLFPSQIPLNPVGRREWGVIFTGFSLEDNCCMFITSS